MIQKASHLYKRFLKQFRIRTLGPHIKSCQRLSDHKFLSLFSLPKVSNLVAEGNLPGAKAELLKYYHTKISSSWLMPPKTITDLRLNTDRMSVGEILNKANKFLELKFAPEGSLPKIKLDGTLDWDYNPVSSREWILRLHRHQWWVILGLAYAQAGDERYARAFVSQLLSWIASNPLPPFKNEKSHAWRLMEAGLRLRVSWIPSFALFYHSPNFTDEAKLKMLRSIHDHARFLFHYKTNRNHLLRESNGLAYASVYFCEFQDASTWLNKALNRIEKEIQNQINKDGSHIEISTGYQWLVVDELEKTLDLLFVKNISLLKEDLHQCLVKMYSVLVNLIRPDGTFPELNDGFIRWERSRLAEAGKKLGREDFIYIGTAGQSGKAPQNTSIGFKDAGLFVMRSDWTKDGRYLIFDAGPYGGPHGHEDKLSFELFASGKPFIVDPGSYTYQKSDPFRSYFVGSQGHNTVLIDGMSQIRRWNPNNLNPKPVSGNYATWISRPGFDYVVSSYSEGYGMFSSQKPKNANVITDVTHTRRILFVKPDYWIVIDDMQASANHDYEMLFHTSPEINVNIGAENTATFFAPGTDACLYLVMEDTQEFKISTLKGCVAPIQGWHSVDHHKKIPATAVIIRPPNARSIIWATLLCPLRNDQINDDVAIQRIEVSCENSFAFKVMSHWGIDYIMVSDSEGKKQFGPFESGGRVAVMRNDKSGDLLHTYNDGIK